MDKPSINTEDDNLEFQEEEAEKHEEVKNIDELPKPVEALSIEEKLAYQKIKNKITKWKRSFPQETKELKIKNDMNYEQLCELEKQIEFTVGTCNAGSMIQSTVFGLSSIAESKSSLVGFHLEGYSKTLMTNENFRKVLLEIECIHGSNYTSPYYRLFSTMFYTAGIVHLTNAEKIKKELSEKVVNEDLQKKFDGL